MAMGGLSAGWKLGELAALESATSERCFGAPICDLHFADVIDTIIPYKQYKQTSHTLCMQYRACFSRTLTENLCFAYLMFTIVLNFKHVYVF